MAHTHNITVSTWFGLGRRTIPAARIWSDRQTYGADIYERRADGSLRFIDPRSIVKEPV